ncbi:TraC family protein [Patescibacteria group bacterium]|nr:TraC family protein [Patescibacteria group bacterium]
MATDPTQSFVPLEEIRDGVVVLKDGSLRAVLMASSINFALKSSDEQQAILSQFQNFLNTLDFSVQFYVQSRELDINPYLELLASREAGQKNDLMKVQLREYIGFIRSFAHDTDIMTKSFFVIVSYVPAKVDVSKGLKSLFGNSKKKNVLPDDAFEEDRSQLEQRIAVVEQGLARVGVRTVTLGTNEVVDLFYHIFNPNEGKKALPPQ